MHRATTDKYILNEAGQAVPEPDLLTWARWFETSDRQLAEDEIGDIRVSTVFLGLDHSFGDGPPLLWESMAFGAPELRKIFGRKRPIREDMGVQFESLDQRRYATREDALRGHAEMVSQVHRLRALLSSPADVDGEPADGDTGEEQDRSP